MHHCCWAQPMVRYDLGDMAVVGTPCEHGIAWPVIENIEGRVRDGITLSDGSFHMVYFFDSTLITDLRVRDYVVLKFENAVVVCVQIEGGLDAAMHADIESQVSKAFAGMFPVHVIDVDQLPPATAKARREWFPAIGEYSSQMSIDQILASASR